MRQRYRIDANSVDLRIAAQSKLPFHGLNLIGGLVLEHRTGSKVAAHLAVFGVKPIDDLVLGKFNSLSELHRLDHAGRVVDAPGVLAATRLKGRYPEEFAAVIARGNPNLDREVERIKNLAASQG